MMHRLWIVCLLLIVACNNEAGRDKIPSQSSDSTAVSAMQTTVQRSPAAATLDCNSVTINPIPKEIRQPKTMACWATVLTMMYEWKEKKNLAIDEVMKKIGEPYPTLFKANTGLSAEQKVRLLSDAGLVAEVPASLTIEVWCRLLQRFGPLWVTTDESPDIPASSIHARLLYGLFGDGTPEGTFLQFIDPADGKRVSEPFNEFVRKYEAELRKIYRNLYGRPLSPDFKLRIQIMHFN